jgi:hypothetical protein
MPEVFYRMAPRDYYAIVEGYNNKRRYEAGLLRLSVWASLSNWTGSITFADWCNKFFPLWFDGEHKEDTAPVQMSKEEIAALFERHKTLHAVK